MRDHFECVPLGSLPHPDRSRPFPSISEVVFAVLLRNVRTARSRAGREQHFYLQRVMRQEHGSMEPPYASREQSDGPLDLKGMSEPGRPLR
jgi:hypothetical protein